MGDDLKDLYERSLKTNEGNSSKPGFTPEEAEKFKKAFDDPEFRSIFSEYLEEMQNPVYRQETEEYIRQLEGDKQVPEGKELIRPVAGFVAKTRKSGLGSSIDKVFLNIVYSENIARPSKTAAAQGQSWSLPYSLGPPHMEKDKSGSNATCFDCCFHPETEGLGEADPRFRDLLVRTALEGVDTFYQRAGQKVDLHKDYHIVKGVKYKEGHVPTMLISQASKAHWEPEPSQTQSLSQPAKKEPAVKKGFLSSSSSSKDQNKDSLIQEVRPGEAVAPAQPQVQMPKYSMKERGSVGLGDFESTRSQTHVSVASSRPEALVYTVHLPLLSSAAGLVLDVSERSVRLESPHKYLLALDLPYPVLDKKGTAKFDKVAQTLTLTLPVQPPPRPSPPVPASEPDQSQSSEPEEPQEEIKESSPDKDKVHSLPHDRWVKGAPGSSRELSEKIRLEADEAQRAYLSRPVLPVAEPSSAPELEDSSLDFYPSASYQGRRPGFVFTSGTRGLGYYLDSPLCEHLSRGQKEEDVTWESRQTDARSVTVRVDLSAPHDSWTVKFHREGRVDLRRPGLESLGWEVLREKDGSLAPLDPSQCRFDFGEDNLVLLLSLEPGDEGEVHVRRWEPSPPSASRKDEDLEPRMKREEKESWKTLEFSSASASLLFDLD